MDWEYSREPWRPARPSFMDIGDSTTRDFAQNPPLEKYRGKWENGRTKISGRFWGLDFSWTSGEDPRSIGALLAALSPKMPLNCTEFACENLAGGALLLIVLPFSRLRFLAGFHSGGVRGTHGGLLLPWGPATSGDWGSAGSRSFDVLEILRNSFVPGRIFYSKVKKKNT